MKRIYILLAVILLNCGHTLAQDVVIDSVKLERILLDSIFLAEFEESKPDQKPKVLHAEPLYIDLIRDLGARKEKRNGT